MGRTEYLAGLAQQQLGCMVEKRRNLIVQIGWNGDHSAEGHVRQDADAAVDVVALDGIKPGAVRQTDDHLEERTKTGWRV